ncbi:hypothetical protein SERLA73DRAFT_183304 [Serpula lacrymans var. lacrymans S7.3]|uniref:Uncharacterized protein n=2 Tax=Serpula lacrymans var. lacrymans TaxID=341189 RepID=F8PZM6_SERL3|nr:uncharacterized protein SERLADRAFT_470387 [Serpula lacrymans var. lacrymans S7.9]EGN98348.1 hypothetical protein SERLA73DRAFT_183304 [Serpula lacrymans var. lacrymans S7.3]EGO23910.1 hypothetical protein SERLADRAFT_470387 [Serpula lacrymans var. lacrymans S7.9]
MVSSLNLITGAFYLTNNTDLEGHGLTFALNLSDVFVCRLILSLRRQVTPTESTQLEEQSRIVREALDALDTPNEV